MNAQHLSIGELADAAEGLLDPERAAFAESHIADCPDCQSQSEALQVNRPPAFTGQFSAQSHK